ncbi:ABC transporter permease [Ruania halotolerans]|uniref:ABC transporter permease n=1 Tax=Ruania halotolerans TaxID=2897773 RepID=UPI001E36EFB8|nr:ABC transporter permease [Ruania halotolerans]UFU06564.1 ABC transporter permease [Ruania halotolerans]
MTERADQTAVGHHHDDLDTTGLAYSGRAPSHAEMAGRARRFGAWYYAETTLRGMRAYLVPNAITAIGQPLLYIIAMGLGLGALVGSGVGTVDGVDYLTFVAPALLVSTVVMSVTGEMTYPVMAGFKWMRTYYGPGATALRPDQIALGHLLAVVIRFVVQSAIFWVIAVAFGATTLGWSVLMVPIGVLAAVAFGAPLQAYAASLEGEGFQFSFVQRFIVMPMFLFSGTFFPLSVMPVYLQWIGWLSPVWHGTQLARVASYGAEVPGWLIAVHVVVLAAAGLAGVLWARRVYARRLIS